MRPMRWAVVIASAGRALCREQQQFQLQDVQVSLGEMAAEPNAVSMETRAYWMRQASRALRTPCPFAAFGSVIVNHTGAAGLGDLICTGANRNRETGNPTLHGEIDVINNCSAILTDPEGPYRLSPREAAEAFHDLSLYTNAESCPMCASAIRWAGFREYIYGTSIETLIQGGWGQIAISSREVFDRSSDLPQSTVFVGSVLSNETDPYFLWQFDPDYPCPSGCSRLKGACVASRAS